MKAIITSDKHIYSHEVYIVEADITTRRAYFLVKLKFIDYVGETHDIELEYPVDKYPSFKKDYAQTMAEVIISLNASGIVDYDRLMKEFEVIFKKA